MPLPRVVGAPSPGRSGHLRPARTTAFGLVALLALAAPAAVHGEDPVLVNITGPLAAKLGDKVSFEVELVNRSGRPLTGLRVIDYFDKGFHHEASASPIEQRTTIDMAAGTSRRLTLDFLTDEPGRQCHRVEILDQAHTFMGGATECVLVTAPAAPAVAAPGPTTAAAPTPAPAVATPAPVRPAVPVPVPVPTTATPQPTVALPSTTTLPPALPARPTTIAPAAVVPSLELDMTGPNELADGAVGEFTATVRNTGAAPSGPTQLEFDWDPTYAPLEASDGYVLGTNKVTWTIPTIPPGGQERRQINLRAQAAAGTRGGQASRACVRGVISEGVGGVMVADESCVAVRSSAPAMRTPREAGIRLSVADTADPVQVGGETTVVCTVSNNGGAASGRLRLVMELPQGAVLVGDPVPSRVGIEGRVLSFDAIPSVPPGGHVAFEARYRLQSGTTGGRAVTLATLSGEQLDGRVETDCTTTFLAP